MQYDPLTTNLNYFDFEANGQTSTQADKRNIALSGQGSPRTTTPAPDQFMTADPDNVLPVDGREYCSKIHSYKVLSRMSQGIITIIAGIALIVFGALQANFWAVGAGICGAASGIWSCYNTLWSLRSPP